MPTTLTYYTGCLTSSTQGRAVDASCDRNKTYRLLQLPGDEAPIDDLPKCLQVLRPHIAVVDVVGVLPYVADQQRHAPAVIGFPALLVLSTAKPPSGFRTSHTQPEPKSFVPASVNSAWNLAAEPNAFSIAVGQRPGRLAPARRQAIPIEGVVPVLGRVVEDRPGRPS